MFARPTAKRLRRLIPAALVLTLIGVFVAPAVFARIFTNTIDPIATITGDGRHIILTGPVGCDAVEAFYVRVTVTQRSTGAVAEGANRIICTGTLADKPLAASF
jgi:hypothetical protein